MHNEMMPANLALLLFELCPLLPQLLCWDAVRLLQLFKLVVSCEAVALHVSASSTAALVAAGWNLQSITQRMLLIRDPYKM
jgi:hypothetical protein